MFDQRVEDHPSTLAGADEACWRWDGGLWVISGCCGVCSGSSVVMELRDLQVDLRCGSTWRSGCSLPPPAQLAPGFSNLILIQPVGEQRRAQTRAVSPLRRANHTPTVMSEGQLVLTLACQAGRRGFVVSVAAAASPWKRAP